MVCDDCLGLLAWSTLPVSGFITIDYFACFIDTIQLRSPEPDLSFVEELRYVISPHVIVIQPFIQLDPIIYQPDGTSQRCITARIFEWMV